MDGPRKDALLLDLPSTDVHHESMTASGRHTSQLGQTTAAFAPKSLRSNFSWSAIGTIVYAACQWGIITVLAKSGTPAMVGQFALAVAITAPISQFFNLQLRGVQATDARREFAFADYFSLRALTTAIALMLACGVAMAGDFAAETVAVIVLVAVAKAIDAISDAYYGLFQQREQMQFIARAMIGNGVASLLLLSIGVLATGSVVTGAVGYAIGSMVPLVGFVLPTGRRLLAETHEAEHSGERWNQDAMFRLARTALPLGIVMLLISLNTNIPRYFIEAARGEHGLGIFAALAYLIVAGTTIVSALGQAVSPRLAQLYAAGQIAQYREILTRLIKFGLLLGLAGAVLAWLIGPEIVSILYTPEYADYRNVLVVLALAAGITFAASFAGYGMTAARYFRVQVPVFGIVVITCLVASAVLIPTQGLLGGALALLATAAVQLTASLTVVAHAMSKRGGAA